MNIKQCIGCYLSLKKIADFLIKDLLVTNIINHINVFTFTIYHQHNLNFVVICDLLNRSGQSSLLSCQPVMPV